MKTDNDNIEPLPETLPFWRRTFSSLRYRNYRLLWFSSWAEHLGQFLEMMAIAWLMKELTESPYYLGLLAVSRVAPLFFFALLGGVVTDKVDRRKLLISTLLGGAIISMGLLILVRLGMILPWHLLAAGALSATMLGFNHPARDAIIPNVTPKQEWMNAIALDGMSVRAAMVIAAPLAGWGISLFGTMPLFGARAVGMVLAILLLLMARVPPTPSSPRKQAPWRNLSQGLKYALGNSLIMALIFLFALREFEMEMSGIFMPFFATDILQSGAVGFGYLNLANGISSLVGLFILATLGDFKHKGRLIIVTGIIAGVFLGLFALSHWLVLSALLLMVAGSSGTVFESVSRTTLQTLVPDEMRGRIMSLREAVRGVFGPWVAYGLGLGGEYLGVVTATLILGLFVSVAISLLALLFPSFRKL